MCAYNSLSIIENYAWATSNKQQFDQYVTRYSGETSLSKVYGICTHGDSVRADQLCITKYVTLYLFVCLAKYVTFLFFGDNYSELWSYKDNVITFSYRLDKTTWKMKKYDINDGFRYVMKQGKNFLNDNNVIRCKLWVDGFYVSTHSKQPNAS